MNRGRSSSPCSDRRPCPHPSRSIMRSVVQRWLRGALMRSRTCHFRLSVQCLAAAAVLSFCADAAADSPKVVKASPDNGDTDVDPNLKEIRIEFDQDMLSGSHSVCGGGDTFPQQSGKLHWANKRTFVIPVKLEPNHDYHIGINCPAAMNFKSVGRESVEPYPISFKTGDGKPKGPGSQKATLEANRAAVR